MLEKLSRNWRTARRSRVVALLLSALLCTAPAGALPAPGQEIGRQEPLPLDVVLSLRGHNGRSPINLSPDGDWVAHTIETADTVPRGDSYAYSATGVPFAEGNARMQATLTHTRTDEVIVLGDGEASSWAPSWAPDGRRVAFYSDEGGTAGLWIWNRETRRARRVGDAVVRPFFGFEAPRWSADGERLLVKLLPTDRTLAEANALLPASRQEPEPPAPSPDEASVTVRRTEALVRVEGAAEPGPEPAGEPGVSPALRDRMTGFAVDLALVEASTGRITRIVDDEPIRLYAFSPDGRRVAHTVFAGQEPDAQQTLYELRLHDREAGEDTVLGEDIPLRYGIEWSFSPEGGRLVYIESGQMADGDLVIVDLAAGTTRVHDDVPNFAPGEGEVPPIWSADGATLYGVADGVLWSVDPETGAAREVAEIEGWRIAELLTPEYSDPVAFATGDDRTLWVTADEVEGTRSGIYAVDVGTGAARPALQEDKSYSGTFSLAASRATGEIVYVSRDQQHLGELWALATGVERPGFERTRRISRINADLDRYALGRARLIYWRSTHGEPLAGTLLLPPGHEPGERLPLVVWVYGGNRGSRAINRFGLWGAAANLNMHVLATRGYAVLYPDAPLRTGRTTDDLEATVLPGINAAIEGGWADPERVAIMGQSYGSLNTLALLTRTDRFRAAVITAAVLHPDLFADYLGTTGYWEQGQGDMGGTIWEYPDRYRDNSPLFDFPRIDTPLLIGQGAMDGDLVPAEAIYAALERLDKPVEYRLYAGEGHVLNRRANVIDFWERRLEFLARHLDLAVEADGHVRAR